MRKHLVYCRAGFAAVFKQLQNVLVLTNPHTFQNTTIIPSAVYIPAVASAEHGARHYFSGYVFRGDSRPPKHVLEAGFILQQPLESMEQAQVMAGAGAHAGITWSEGISTSICAQAAAHYCRHPVIRSVVMGCVYLINALHFRGFAIPTPRPTESLATRFPILQQIYEVNFMHGIPNTNIVGVLWPGDSPMPQGGPWPFMPDQLKLAVNPEYEGGMAGAREVVECFNS